MVSIITFGLSSQKCFVCFCLVQDVLTSRWDLNSQLINGEHYLQLNLQNKYGIIGFCLFLELLVYST